MNHRALLDDYYSAESIKEWQAIIGDELHYHYGFFTTPDTDLKAALENAVRNFYDYIPRGSGVLDAGCGWGGPARMLNDERECKVFGITISHSQYEYCRKFGLKVKGLILSQLVLSRSLILSFDFGQLYVVFPQGGGIAVGEIGT
jgi:cyclopropane fatty-acyl-phospholipid synthase-like methyltransferase